jgi:hypothetical protein
MAIKCYKCLETKADKCFSLPNARRDSSVCDDCTRLKGILSRRKQIEKGLGLRGEMEKLQHKLWLELGGTVEYVTPLGTADLVTSSEVIEIHKEATPDCFRVLAFASYLGLLPKLYVIHAPTDCSVQKHLESVCQLLNIKLVYGGLN